MVGPSTGGPNLHNGPLPLQAWPPSSAGLKSTKTCSLLGHGNKQHKCQQHNPLLHSSDGPPHNPLITPSHPHHWQSPSKWPWPSLPWLYRAKAHVCPPGCLQIVCPEPKLKIPDTGLIGGKLLIRAMIPTPGLTNPLLKSVKIPQTGNTHKLAVIHKQQTYYNMYQLDNLPIIVTE